jgi:hypothetical protein
MWLAAAAITFLGGRPNANGEIHSHVLSKTAKVDSREARAAEDLVEILHRYIK